MLTTLGIPIHSNSDDRNKATASPSSARRSVVVWMLVGLGILILTIFGYIRTLKRSKEEPQNDRPEQESESLPNGSKLVHALFSRCPYHCPEKRDGADQGPLRAQSLRY